MRVFRVTVAGALFLFAVTATFGMSVKSDYEKNFDFSQLHTFAFKTDRSSNDPLSTNTLEAGRIQNALTAQLEANGFTQATGNPDFIVAFYSRTNQKTQVQSVGGFGPVFGPGFWFGLWHSLSRALALGLWTRHLAHQLHSRLRHGRHNRPANQ